MVSSRFTIQIRKYSPPVARNSKGTLRRATGAEDEAVRPTASMVVSFIFMVLPDRITDGDPGESLTRLGQVPAKTCSWCQRWLRRDSRWSRNRRCWLLRADRGRPPFPGGLPHTSRMRKLVVAI